VGGFQNNYFSGNQNENFHPKTSKLDGISFPELIQLQKANK
jgi:hypothetical protein